MMLWTGGSRNEIATGMRSLRTCGSGYVCRHGQKMAEARGRRRRRQQQRRGLALAAAAPPPPPTSKAKKAGGLVDPQHHHRRALACCYEIDSRESVLWPPSVSPLKRPLCSRPAAPKQQPVPELRFAHLAQASRHPVVRGLGRCALNVSAHGAIEANIGARGGKQCRSRAVERWGARACLLGARSKKAWHSSLFSSAPPAPQFSLPVPSGCLVLLLFVNLHKTSCPPLCAQPTQNC